MISKICFVSRCRIVLGRPVTEINSSQHVQKKKKKKKKKKIVDDTQKGKHVKAR